MQKTRRHLPALNALAAALALFAAGSAQAVDWSGYFRGGPAATNVSGKSRQCYGLSEPGLKYRLGNECDFYGEFTLSQPVKTDGIEYSANLMTNFYSPSTETDLSNGKIGIEQAYVDIKGIDIAPKATFWMGKRRDRNDVHIVDTFFVNMSGVGAGVRDLDAGPGKLAFSIYKTDNAGGNNGGARAHVDFYDLPVNAGGKLRVIGTVSATDSAGPTATKGKAGGGLSVEHVQSNFLGWNGENHVWAQTVTGSTPLNQGFSSDLLSANGSNKGVRLVDSFTFQVGPLGGQTLALWQQTKDTAGAKTSSSTIGGRVSYALTKNVKFLTELGISNKKPDGSASQNLTKLTVGPALSTGPDFWKRPELRFYVTQASFNKAAAADLSNGLPTGKTSATSFGAQVEVWF